MQFHVIVVSIFLQTCVKDHGDRCNRLRERRIWLVCIEALLLVVHSFWTCIFDALFHSLIMASKFRLNVGTLFRYFLHVYVSLNQYWICLFFFCSTVATLPLCSRTLILPERSLSTIYSIYKQRTRVEKNDFWKLVFFCFLCFQLFCLLYIYT